MTNKQFLKLFPNCPLCKAKNKSYSSKVRCKDCGYFVWFNANTELGFPESIELRMSCYHINVFYELETSILIWNNFYDQFVDGERYMLKSTTLSNAKAFKLLANPYKLERYLSLIPNPKIISGTFIVEK